MQNKGWNRFEKFVSVYQILIGALFLVTGAYFLYINIQLLFDYLNITWQDLDLFRIIKKYHFAFIYGLFSIAAGILLWKQKLLGWIFSINNFLVSIVVWIDVILSKEIETDQGLVIAYFLCGILIMLTLAQLIPLLLKPIRTKYKPSVKSWIIVGLITILFCIDKLLIVS